MSALICALLLLGHAVSIGQNGAFDGTK